jgi:hypothetical protein
LGTPSGTSSCEYREQQTIAPGKSADFSRPDTPGQIEGVLEARASGRAVCMPLSPPDQPPGLVVANVSDLSHEACPVRRSRPAH